MARLTIEKSRKRPKTVDKKRFYHRVYLDKLNEGSYRPSIGLDWYPLKSDSALEQCRTIGRLEDMLISGSDFMDSELNENVRKLPDNVRKSLLKRGLIKDSKRNMTVAELEQQFFDSKLKLALNGKLDSKTPLTYRENLIHFLQFQSRDHSKRNCERTISDITSGDIKEFREYLDESSNSSYSNRSFLSRVRTLFNFAVEKEWILRNPFTEAIKSFRGSKSEETIRLQKERFNPEVRSKVLTWLFNNESAEWYLFAAIQGITMMRPFETQCLLVDDIKEDDTLNGEPFPHIFIRKGKGGKKRKVPVFKELIPAIKRWRKELPEGAVYAFNKIFGLENRKSIENRIHPKTGKPMEIGRKDTNQTSKDWVEMLNKMGIKDIWPQPWYVMRGTRQTDLTNSGKYSPRAICAIAGNSIPTFNTYYDNGFDDASLLRALGAEKSVQEVCVESVESLPKTLEVFKSDTFAPTDIEFERFQASAVRFEKATDRPTESSLRLINALLQSFVSKTCADNVQPSNSDMLLLLTNMIDTLSKTEPCLAQDRLANPFKT